MEKKWRYKKALEAILGALGKFQYVCKIADIIKLLSTFNFNYFLILNWGYVYWFKEGRESKRNNDQLPPLHIPAWDQTHTLGMPPDQESNLQPLVYGTMLQPTEPPGQDKIIV